MHFGVAAANDFFGRCIHVIPWKFLLRRGQPSNSLAGLQAPQPLAGVVLFIERWSTTARSWDNSSCIYRIQAIAAWIRIREIRQAPAKRWDVLNSQGAVGLNPVHSFLRLAGGNSGRRSWMLLARSPQADFGSQVWLLPRMHGCSARPNRVQENLIVLFF